MIVARDEVRLAPSVEHGGRLGFAAADDIRPSLIDFSVCLNAFGPATSIVEAVRAAPIDEYPDPRAVAARAAVAKRWAVPMPAIVLGAGAAELIQAVCLAYVRPTDLVLIVEPAFGEYRRAAALGGANVEGVSLSAGDDPLAGARREVEHRRPRLVFVASPVNPTGVALDRASLRAIADSCARVDALLVLDQAYDAFSEHPLGTPALRDHTHVLHLRSLTKEHALAGVRVAVGVGPASVVAAIERVRVPWATSTAAQAATIAALDEPAEAHARATVARLRVEGARLANGLRELGGRVSPSATHYMLIRCENAKDLRDRLAATHGILVRDCTSFGLPHHVRVAARRPHENDLLLEALRATL